MAKKQLTETTEMSSVTKQVLFTQLHENLFIPEVGDFGKSINLDPKYAKTKDLKMVWDGVSIEWTYDDGVKKAISGFIPGPNIKSGIYK